MAGIDISVTPSGDNASITAFIKAGGDAIAPASPQPLTPQSLTVEGVVVYPTLNDGRSSALGIQ